MGDALPLSPAEVDEARQMINRGKSVVEVADWLGCEPAQVRGAVANAPERDRTSVGLRDILFDEILRLRRGESGPQEAQAIASLSKQILSVTKLEMDYAKQKEGGKSEAIKPIQLGSATAAAATSRVTEASSAMTADTPVSET